MKSRVSAIVGQGQVSSVLERRLVRGGPSNGTSLHGADHRRLDIGPQGLKVFFGEAGH
jgi:hypothetical protein